MSSNYPAVTSAKSKSRDAFLWATGIMFVGPFVLFFLPVIGGVIGGFIAGVVGGKVAGKPGRAVLAALVPAIVYAFFVALFSIFHPVGALFLGIHTFVAAALGVISVIVGAFIGGIL